jgi:hypothetical protein
MDKAEACGALKLTAADATDEDGSPQPVSEILQRIWDVCEFIDSSHFRVLPCQLAKHLNAPSNVVKYEELFPIMVNHLRIANKENLFCCSTEVVVCKIPENIAKETAEFLKIGGELQYWSHNNYGKRQRNKESESEADKERHIDQFEAREQERVTYEEEITHQEAWVKGQEVPKIPKRRFSEGRIKYSINMEPIIGRPSNHHNLASEWRIESCCDNTMRLVKGFGINLVRYELDSGYLYDCDGKPIIGDPPEQFVRNRFRNMLKQSPQWRDEHDDAPAEGVFYPKLVKTDEPSVVWFYDMTDVEGASARMIYPPPKSTPTDEVMSPFGMSTMTVEKVQGTLTRYEDNAETDIERLQQAKCLSLLGAYDQPVDPDISLSKQVEDLCKKEKVYSSNLKLNVALNLLKQKLRLKISQNKPLEGPIVGSSMPSPITTSMIFTFPGETDLYQEGIKLLRNNKDKPVSANNLSKLITYFPAHPILISSEIWEQKSRGENISQSAMDYLSKNLIKLIFNQAIADKVCEFEEAFVKTTDVSINEVQTFDKSFQETEFYITDNRQMREGPSSLSFMTTGIPLEILKRHVTIIVGTSDIYRNLYVSHNKHMIAELLNFSPPICLTYGCQADETNQLYVYLADIINQIGSKDYFPSIFVEYYSNEREKTLSFDEFIEQANCFIDTLSAAQKLYQGLIVCLGPAPYWTIGSDINEYRSQKYMNRRVTECLSVLGYLRGIYVSNPEIVTLPIYHPVYEHSVGYLCQSKFRNLPLFDRNSEYTAEACRRALRGVRKDIRRINKFKFPAKQGPIGIKR